MKKLIALAYQMAEQIKNLKLWLAAKEAITGADYDFQEVKINAYHKELCRQIEEAISG